MGPGVDQGGLQELGVGSVGLSRAEIILPPSPGPMLVGTMTLDEAGGAAPGMGSVLAPGDLAGRRGLRGPRSQAQGRARDSPELWFFGAAWPGGEACAAP